MHTSRKHGKKKLETILKSSTLKKMKEILNEVYGLNRDHFLSTVMSIEVPGGHLAERILTRKLIPDPDYMDLFI